MQDKELVDDTLDAIKAATDFVSAAALFALGDDPTRREITKLRALADRAVGQIYKVDSRVSKLKPNTKPRVLEIPKDFAAKVLAAPSSPCVPVVEPLGPNIDRSKMELTKLGRETLESVGVKKEDIENQLAKANIEGGELVDPEFSLGPAFKQHDPGEPRDPWDDGSLADDPCEEDRELGGGD